MNWGKWIFIVFVLFAFFIGTLVTVCVRQDTSLVTPEYYKDELAYQTQLERKENANALTLKPEVTIANTGLLEIHYANMNAVSSGTVKLFRPSDSRLDQEFVLNPTENTVQQFKLKVFEKGLYKAKMLWTMNGKEYYLEKIIVM